jgi:hypothetical protein
MEAGDVLEAIAGGLLLFVVPGLTVARALFPEWRFHGPDAARRSLETATLAFVLSVALTVLVGSALLGLAPGGFSAAWSDPLLEAVLAGVALVGFVAGVLRGAYAAGRVPAAAAGAPDPEEGPFELVRRLDRLEREDRALRRRAGQLSSTDPRAEEVGRRRAEIAREIRRLEADREESYAR